MFTIQRAPVSTSTIVTLRWAPSKYQKSNPRALMSDVHVPLNVLRPQIASAVDTIVQVSRCPDGSRYVTHVTEVLGYDPENGYRINHLFERPTESGRRE